MVVGHSPPNSLFPSPRRQRPGLLSLSFSLPLTNVWARAVIFFLSPPSAVRVRVAFPWPRRLEPLNPQPQTLSFRCHRACRCSNPSLSRRRNSSFQASSSRFEFADRFRPVSPHHLASSRLRELAVATEPPLVVASFLRCLTLLSSLESWKTEFPSSSFAQLRRTSVERRRAPSSQVAENGPFERDQDQVYEEEEPQCFEEGKAFLRRMCPRCRQLRRAGYH
ncbi:hypothetical protein HU200_066083 [Digitaria exilis]|uniref:Uncharacterized protein n=1 Tax=Digitaria exilis TaxID=1010633 RepID=A0A834ZYW8_9POAL|nr:hypothetical protein HU200_066083 [Digitaria exilis]